MRKKIVSLIPFLIIGLLALYTWLDIVFTGDAATWRHYVGLVLLLFNAGLYFVKFKPAVLLTGIVLVLGTFGLLTWFVSLETWALRVGDFSTPDIQYKALLLLVIYGVINFNFLVDWRLDVKEAAKVGK